MNNNVFHIYPLSEPKCFSEDEAYHLVDVFIAITRKSQNEINSLNVRLESYRNFPDKADGIQFQINLAIQKWSDKVRRLGGVPVALFKVKIPTYNQRYYIWEFPKSSIQFID